jgi:SAM-dependent methyltransferase
VSVPGLRCPVCRAPEPFRALSRDGVPVNSVQLWPTAAEALAVPRAAMHLEYCRACGHLWNSAFDARLVAYTPSYDASLHFSPRFQRDVEVLVDRLVAELEPRGARLLEIGCGKGEFLDRLCRRGGCRGVGYDTSFSGEIPADAPWRIERCAFPAAGREDVADGVVARHVLEHVVDPLAFVQALRAVVERSPTGWVFLEVPNGEWILRDLGIWDVIYEHVSIFTPLSLGALLRHAGLAVRWQESAFDGQYLRALAEPCPPRPERPAPAALAAQLAEVQRFGADFRAKIEHWSTCLRGFAAAGRRVALWGAGAKGTTFLSCVEPREAVRHVVDVNPRKVGRYVSLTGQRIEAPEALRGSGVDAILVMNPAYAAEIETSARALGLQPELFCV